MNKLIVLVLPALLAGCATSSTPNYDARFGDAVRAAKARQTLNPAAGANPDIAAGMDGKTARDAQVLYQNTFKTPPPVVNVINIGGQIGAGGSR
jgi:hypothetical protein